MFGKAYSAHRRFALSTKIKILACLLSSLILVGCGGGGGEEPSGSQGGVPLTGQLLDSAVGGINYSSQPSGLSGTTNSLGEFNFEAGDLITFSIGSIIFPAVPVPATGIMTPLTLAQNNNINDPAVVAMARLLQSLDSVGTVDDGITIDPAAHVSAQVASCQTVDFTNLDFDSDPCIQNVLSGMTVVDEATAIAHLQSNIDNLPQANVPPTAAFSILCTELDCTFTNSSTDSDGSIASYAWNFGDGNSASAQNPTHTYSAAGTYSVSLMVTDDDGATDTTSSSVTVTAPNVSPTAAFSNRCTNLGCTFSNLSTDGDGSIVSYAWNFGDGNSASVQNPTHTYGVAGTYTVSLTVTDDDGATDTYTNNSFVVTDPPQPNVSPTAAFSSLCTDLGCTFTNSSTDSDGNIVSYAWSFGDGINSSAQNPAHTYGAAGTYTVSLTVTDDDGATGTTSNSVSVAAPNVRPMAAFSSLCTDLGCTFANSSTDSDGSIASYAWSFGDGNNASAQHPTHTYGVAGTYTVLLTVTDDDGATNAISSSVTVTAPNVSPTAAFSHLCTDLGCIFTSSSSDSDGSIASYAWNFGDGNNATAQHPTHTYGAAGTYAVSLTVTDDDGATNATSSSVSVTEPNVSPTAAFSHLCTDLGCTFTSSSTDSDGSIASYAWSFGDGNNATAQNPTHTYGAAGTYTVSLTVTDDDGATDSTNSIFTVTEPNVSPTAAFSSRCTYLDCTFTNSSTDSDGSISSYAWNFGDANNASAQDPIHTYGAAGTYTVSLTVTDDRGATDITSSSVTVTEPPPPPPIVTADAGPILGILIPGGEAILDGSASSAINTTDALSFAWSFLAKPDGSNAVLTGATTATPSFFPDVVGTYRVQLFVTAGGVTSKRAIGYVEAGLGGNLTGNRHLHHRRTGDAGDPSQCGACHDGRYYWMTQKTATHEPTSNVCEACHSTLGFELISFVDHDEVFGQCSECHNGTTAVFHSVFHVDTTGECDECHNTNAFLDLQADGSYDHTGINRNCIQCHTGIAATGKDEGHVVTNSDCVRCHVTDTFTLTHFDHSAIDLTTQPCESCHDGSTAVGKSGIHPSTSDQCAMCHNTDSFAQGDIFDHSGIDFTVQRCDACHNNDDIAANVQGATAKPSNHMPTTEDCQVCHDLGTFTTGFYDHAGVTNNCATCHDGLISIGFSADHLPTSEDCSVCHADTTDFAVAVFSHDNIFGNCSSCHDGSISTGKDSASNHIPTVDDCSVCHIDTSTFTATDFLTNEHQQIFSGCEGCHDGTIATGKDAAGNHIPTTQDCRFCHQNNTTFIDHIFTHDGITGNCASCHNGSYVAEGARAETSSAVHQNTSEDCGVCHNTANFADAFVDHTSADVLSRTCESCHDGNPIIGKSAKTNPDHVITSQDCDVCHTAGATFANAVFDHTGITDNCASCHDTGQATGKPVDHLPTSEDCSLCHNTTAFAGARFDHTGITGNCQSCHDGTIAIGQDRNHVPTSQDCNVCHQTTGFIPATFDHRGIVDNCESCHDGVFSIGKPTDHIQTNSDCGVCHNTTAFFPATFDHSGIVNGCVDCHDGITATGQDRDHLPTNLDCYLCHTTATFQGGTWDHTGITGNCQSCHNGSDATGNQPQGRNQHFITTADCNACHSTNGWVPTDRYNHPNNSDYPGDHNRNVSCKDCHRDNDENISYPHPQYAGTCASCHAGDFDNGEHDGGLSNNLNCGDSGCHRVSDRNWD